MRLSEQPVRTAGTAKPAAFRAARVLGLFLLVCATPGLAGAAAPSGKAKGDAKPLKVRVVKQEAFRKELGRHRGRVVLVHFWATWCLPCLDELPLVSKFADEMKTRGLDVVSLSLDAGPDASQKVAAMLGERAPKLSPLIMEVRDPDAFMRGVDPQWEGAIPAIFAFDGKGDLRGSYVGEASRKQMEDLVSYMLKPADPKMPGSAKP